MSRNVGVEQVQGEVMRELERRFSPEFRNRIDEVVLFAPLAHDEVREIAKHYLAQVTLTLAKAGKTIAGRRRGARADRDAGLQHGVRRAVPEAGHRREDQAADQRALEGRLALRGEGRRTARSSSNRAPALVVATADALEFGDVASRELRRSLGLRRSPRESDLFGFLHAPSASGPASRSRVLARCFRP